MEDLKLVWKIDSGGYGSPQGGYLGKWRVVSVIYDGSTSRDDPNKQKLICLLPGIKDVLGLFKTDKEAKELADNVVKIWLTGLSNKQ